MPRSTVNVRRKRARILRELEVKLVTSMTTGRLDGSACQRRELRLVEVRSRYAPSERNHTISGDELGSEMEMEVGRLEYISVLRLSPRGLLTVT
jgi:hypothetical protein